MYLVLLPPIFAILGNEFGVTLTDLGVAVGVLGVFGMLFQLPFGYVSDNYSRTLTLGIGLGLGAVGVLMLAFAPNYYWLLLSQAVLGTGIAAHHPAHYPLLSDATRDGNLGRVFSVHGFAGNLGYAVAPAVITGIVAIGGMTWRHAFFLIGIVGGAYAVFAVAILAWHVSEDVTGPGRTSEATEKYSLASIRSQVVAELHSLFTSPAVLAFAVLSLVTAITNWGIRSYAVVLLTDGYGLTLGSANAVLTVMFVAAAVLILVGGELSDRFSARLVLYFSYSIVTLAAAAAATLVLPRTVAMICVVLTGGTLMMGGPAKDKLVDKLSVRGDLGKNFAIVSVGVSLGGSVAPPLFGAIIDGSGLQLAFLGVAGFALLGGVTVFAILRSYAKRLVDEPVSEVGGD